MLDDDYSLFSSLSCSQVLSPQCDAGEQVAMFHPAVEALKGAREREREDESDEGSSVAIVSLAQEMHSYTFCRASLKWPSKCIIQWAKIGKILFK